MWIIVEASPAISIPVLDKSPRGSGKYIASFIGFSSVENPQVIAMCLIDEPEGVYYGGTIAAPVIRELYENILPNDIVASSTSQRFLYCG